MYVIIFICIQAKPVLWILRIDLMLKTINKDYIVNMANGNVLFINLIIMS